MRLFGSLTKIEDQPDGTLKVYGVASTGARDDEGEIVLPEAMKAALPDYARYPALREMHQPTAAGRTLEASVDDEGVTHIVAHVVDPVAIAKVKSRTYSGFSIGGRVLARDPGDATVITKIRLSEISLVDRPANPEAIIDLWKADVKASTLDNDAVKTRAAEMAKLAGRPGAWKDYVAKARAALTAEQDDEDADADDDNAASAPPDAWDGDAGEDDEGEGSLDREPAAADDGDDDASSADDSDYDNVGDIAARLAELAGSDPEALQAAHDALIALGAVCNADKCPDADKAVTIADLVKLDGGALVDSLLSKTAPRLDALEHRLAEQDQLIERLAATPLPPRTALSPHARPIGKADDADPSSDSADLTPAQAQKAFAALTPDERALLLMKASLRSPITVG